MIDSIGSSTSLVSSNRASSLRAPGLRSTDILTAVQQSQQRNAGGAAAVKVFAVPQTTGTTPTTPKLPRGSLVDVLA